MGMDVVHGHNELAGDSLDCLSVDMDGDILFFCVARRAASMCINAAAPKHEEISNWDTVLTTQAIL